LELAAVWAAMLFFPGVMEMNRVEYLVDDGEVLA